MARLAGRALLLLLLFHCKDKPTAPAREEGPGALSGVYLLEPSRSKESIKLKSDFSCEWIQGDVRHICAYRHQKGILEIFTRPDVEPVAAFHLSDGGGRGLWAGRVRFLVRCEKCE
ncbi:MAG: hypothetical protein HS115_10715 [Spirochaetales bacterium]|nr:hypothetical protein [Spirochaetales bacterium]